MPIVLKLWCVLASSGELVTRTDAQALPLNQNVWGGACPDHSCRPKAVDRGLPLPTQSQSDPAEASHDLIPLVGPCAEAAECLRLLPGSLSAAPGLHPCICFSCCFPCTPFPVCVLGWTSALFLLWCCQREILKMWIWWCHPILKNTPVTFHCT